MPFQSEKQRRYLWANEPEIARDWTDTYGSGIAKALGGRIPFAEAGAVGTLTASEISDLESMAQTYPDSKIGKEAQKKLDINAGKAVEEKEVGFFEKLLGFSEAEGAETGSAAEDQMRKEFFDYGTQQADIGDTAYSNLKVPGLNVRYPDAPVNWSERDDLEANNYGQGIITALPQQNKGDWLMSALNYLPFFGKNTRTGAFLRMLKSRFMPEDGITSMFNRPTTPQQQATQRFIQDYNVGRNPQTGRMTSGPFAGRNLPGTSMFGSKTPQEMAQNWMKKYGSMNYQTERQMAKQKEIRDIAAGNTNIPPSERIVKPTITPKHGPHQYQGGNGNQSGSTSGRSDAGHAAAGGSGMHGGRHYNRGGLAALWPR